MNPAVIQWIQEQIRRGVSKRDIWQTLAQRGFSQSELIQDFRYAQGSSRQAYPNKAKNQPQSSNHFSEILSHHIPLALTAFASLIILIGGALFFSLASFPLPESAEKALSNPIAGQSPSQNSFNQQSEREQIIGSTSQPSSQGKQPNLEQTSSPSASQGSSSNSGGDSPDSLDIENPFFNLPDDEQEQLADPSLIEEESSTGFCGDNKLNTDLFEVCDGTDFGSNSCQSFGFESGILSCSSTCNKIITDNCGGALCGDNKKEGSEICDGIDLGGNTCKTNGFDDGTLYCLNDCSGFDTSSCTSPACGNNIVEGSEVCDGSVGFKTCKSLGFDSGTLNCKADCSDYDTSGCTSSVACPNNFIEGSEICDGIDLGGETCSSQGFDSGTLKCKSDCSGYDTTSCIKCGNNIRETGEACDGTDLDGKTCLTQVFLSGTLSCKSDCTFDTSDCTVQQCGNGVTEGSEICDGTDLGGQSCTSFGFDEGTLSCESDCSGFITLGCPGSSVCGNNIVEPPEFCDGSELLGNTCTGLGYLSGTLGCAPDCSGFDTDSCVISTTCGNNNIESSEACDGSDLDGLSCSLIGFASGTLGCKPNCDDFDISNCNPRPGEHLVFISQWGFDPAVVTIPKGDTVRWVNGDGSSPRPASDPHPTHNGYPGSSSCNGFDSCSGLTLGGQFTFTFNTAGVWGYHNHNSPSQIGTIVVTE